MASFTRIKLASLTIALLTIIACSPVDSTKPFDQQQAAVLLHAGRVSLPTRQRIKLTLPNKKQWQRIDLSYGTVGSPVMLIPSTETADDWTQSIRTNIKPFAYDRTANADSWIKDMIATAKQHCQHVGTDHLSLSSKDALYQLSLSGCPHEKNQIRIGKVFNGSDAVYGVYYSAVMGKVNEARIREVAAAINTARLVPQ